MAHKILIVDDHPLFRRGLESLIHQEKELQVCGEAASIAEAMKLFQEQHPDIVVADLTLSSGNGLRLIKQIRAHSKTTRILVSSMHDEKLFAERCMRAGANGYVNKEEAASRIIGAIRTILKGSFYLSPAMSSYLAERQLQGTSSKNTSPEENLSNREMEVFILMGKGNTKQNIANELHVSGKTIDTHKEHIKRKLGIEIIPL
jgi:DNA-binding NarL/FixJ family response regulator